MAGKRKHTSYTLDVKRKILTEVDKKVKSKGEISEQYGIPRSTLSTLIKNREKIENSTNPYRKRCRVSKWEDVERTLFIWVQQLWAESEHISGRKLSEKAIEMAKEMQIKDFKPNNGWLDRFKKRYAIKVYAIFGLPRTLNIESVHYWFENVMPELLQKFKMCDIYSANETGLFFSSVPSDTQRLRTMVCAKGEMSRKRLTVLVAVNMDCSDKLPLLVIGKVQNVRIVDNHKDLPLEYIGNSKALMTSAIFETWLRELDSRFKRENRKVVIVVNRCQAHEHINNLEAVTIIHLPHDPDTILQPCDLGIIASFKKCYRRRVLQKLVAHAEEGNEVKTFQQPILDSLCDLKAAWNNVDVCTVKSCYELAGFRTAEDLLSESVNHSSFLHPSHESPSIDRSESPSVDNSWQQSFDFMRRSSGELTHNETNTDENQADDSTVCVQEDEHWSNEVNPSMEQQSIETERDAEPNKYLSNDITHCLNPPSFSIDHLNDTTGDLSKGFFPAGVLLEDYFAVDNNLCVTQNVQKKISESEKDHQNDESSNNESPSLISPAEAKTAIYKLHKFLRIQKWNKVDIYQDSLQEMTSRINRDNIIFNYKRAKQTTIYDYFNKT